MLRGLVYEMKTYYEILGVSRTASPSQIRAAFRRLAKVDHPDSMPGLEDSRFRQFCDAYKTLFNPLKREAYDREILARETETDPL